MVRAPYFIEKRMIEQFIDKKSNWIARTVEKQKGKAPQPTDPQTIAILTRKAEEILFKKVATWSKITGLIPQKIGITVAKTRFGSCSTTGNINFSCYLILYPEPAIDYVVLHELAHLKHPDHSARFYKLIERYMPDYKERVKMLKTQETS